MPRTFFKANFTSKDTAEEWATGERKRQEARLAKFTPIADALIRVRSIEVHRIAYLLRKDWREKSEEASGDKRGFVEVVGYRLQFMLDRFDVVIMSTVTHLAQEHQCEFFVDPLDGEFVVTVEPHDLALADDGI